VENSSSPVVKVQVEVSFPQPTQLAEAPHKALPVPSEAILLTPPPSDGQQSGLGAGNTLKVSGMVTPPSLATSSAMKAWLTADGGTGVTTAALAWQSGSTTSGSFVFSLAGLTNPFVNNWIALNVTADDSGSTTFLGKSISVFLVPPPMGSGSMPRAQE